ncbi:tetratricopeptide repeat protein [Reichenbachiella versicolor]|uniref:tetratricopeptide repeat protein n=1 Tax=Reichenbachiella versicolor TaxID=1821036 RepID=UPI0013A599F2|nr:tetratricopeptide repeat protein [Reichenbachiella versicolor]
MMRLNTRLLLIILSISTAPLCTVYSQDKIDKETEREILLDLPNYDMFKDREKTKSLYLETYKKHIEQEDTTLAIKALIDLGDLYAHGGNFSYSYDNYWDALELAKASNNQVAIMKVHHGLGWQYLIYKRYDLAEKHFKEALKMIKELVTNTSVDTFRLPTYYFPIGSCYRRMEKYNLAKTYLDSADLFQHPSYGSTFTNIERGMIKINEGEFRNALKLMLPELQLIAEKHPKYNTIFHYAIARSYRGLNMLDSSKFYFESAIHAAHEYTSHIDVLPSIYEDYSSLMLSMGEVYTSYSWLKKAKELNEEMFDSRIGKNAQILEIKDQYRNGELEKAQLIKDKEILALQQEDKVWRLRIIISGIIITSLLLIIFLIYRHFRIKYKTKKGYLHEKREIERRRMQDVIDAKNKEMTASTLQVIQKEEILSELKVQLKKISKELNSPQLNKIASGISVSTSQNWKEFETRFIQVNERFYSELNNKYPDLSLGDQKVCALIKLNFSGKDMSRLLGISIESVHTARYRIRKKLNLGRKDNLEKIIGEIGS